MRIVRFSRVPSGPVPFRRACSGSRGLIGKIDQKGRADRAEFLFMGQLRNFRRLPAGGLRVAADCAKGPPFQRYSNGNLRERRLGASLGPLNFDACVEPRRRPGSGVGLESEREEDTWLRR